MKIVNYLVCSMAILAGVVLLMADKPAVALCGVLWLGMMMLSGRTKYGKRVWRKFARTNMEINRIFEG